MSPLAVRLKLRKSKYQFAEEKKRKVKLSAEIIPSVQNKPTWGRIIEKKKKKNGWLISTNNAMVKLPRRGGCGMFERYQTSTG